MEVSLSRVPAEEVRRLRGLHRREMGCQIVHDSLPERGLSDCWLIRVGGRVAGYGCVAGFGGEPKELVDEFYLLPAHRRVATALFRELAAAAGARRIQAQTNDPLLTLMLYDFAEGIEREKVLFEDALTTSLEVPDATFRRVEDGDRPRIFEHEREGVGDWLLEVGGEVVATGGIMLHYNPPYGDLYMEVAASRRRRGYGSFLVQELRRACWEMGRVPAARCDPSNHASRATLQKAGLLPCGSILTGSLKPA